MKVERLFTPDETARIGSKIEAVEMRTSAEVRVAITTTSWLGLKNKARRLFRKYGLDKTEARNGCLLLLDVKNRELLIFGDEGIDGKVGEDFWVGIRDAMLDELREGHTADAICIGLHLVGEKLARHFPATLESTDEISNAIIFER